MNSDNRIISIARQVAADRESWRESYRSAIYETDNRRAGSIKFLRTLRDIVLTKTQRGLVRE
jgi:hypothetical protein